MNDVSAPRIVGFVDEGIGHSSYLVDLGDGTTRVIMQSTANVHGFWKIFATKGLKRDRAYRVTRSHLQALYDLATKGDRAMDLTRGR